MCVINLGESFGEKKTTHTQQGLSVIRSFENISGYHVFTDTTMKPKGGQSAVKSTDSTSGFTVQHM